MKWEHSANGHRQRVRDRITRFGISALADYQILEYILFHCIPRKDTKVIACRLLNLFGSLSAVYSAPIDDLMTVPNMTFNAALFLHTMPAICGSYQIKKLIGRKIVAPGQVVPYVRTIAPLDRESIVLICLDENKNFVSAETMTVGILDSISINSDALFSYSLSNEAKKIIVAHNHPSGDPTPSSNDIKATIALKKAAAARGMELLDHIIIGSQTAYSLFLAKEV